MMESNGREEIDHERVGQANGQSAGEVAHAGAAAGDCEECGREEVAPWGCVYFIETADGQFVKIGFSSTVHSRVRALTALMPGLRVIATLQGNQDMERSLHKRFASNRHTGEWFRNSESLRKFISENAVPFTPGPSDSGGYYKSIKERIESARRATRARLRASHGCISLPDRWLAELPHLLVGRAELWILIYLLLADRDKHSGSSAAVTAAFAGCTLREAYYALDRLTEQGFVECIASSTGRRSYRLSPEIGVSIAKGEAGRQ